MRAERFDIEMHQVAGTRPFVATTGAGGVSRASRLSPARTKTAATVERGTWSWTRDRPGGAPLVARGDDARRHRPASSGAAADAGVEGRSSQRRRARPSGAGPATCTVLRTLMPAAAAAVGGRPLLPAESGRRSRRAYGGVVFALR